MKRFLTVAGLLIASTAPLGAFAKGELVRIEVTGPTLSAPLVVADAKVLREFFIWYGPNSGPRYPIGSPQNADSPSFIDWQEGIKEQVPKGMTVYDVSFFHVFNRQPPEVRLNVRGEVRLRCCEQARLHLSSWSERRELPTQREHQIHDVEGHWFMASSRWESLVAPLIRERAVRSANDIAARLRLDSL